MAMEEYIIRLASAADAGEIARQRARMFQDMGLNSPEETELLREASVPWLAERMEAGDYVGWLVERQGGVVGGGGILLRESGPVPGCLRVGRAGHIVNVYVEPGHRRRGLARRVMETILEWCLREGIDHVTLSASDEGRALYESLGFRTTREMKLAREG